METGKLGDRSGRETYVKLESQRKRQVRKRLIKAKQMQRKEKIRGDSRREEKGPKSGLGKRHAARGQLGCVAGFSPRALGLEGFSGASAPRQGS